MSASDDRVLNLIVGFRGDEESSVKSTQIISLNRMDKEDKVIFYTECDAAMFSNLSGDYLDRLEFVGVMGYCHRNEKNGSMRLCESPREIKALLGGDILRQNLWELKFIFTMEEDLYTIHEGSRKRKKDSTSMRSFVTSGMSNKYFAGATLSVRKEILERFWGEFRWM